VALNPSKPKRMANNKALLNKEFPASFWAELKVQGIIEQDYPYL
jgi:D-threo-aldose 1-dehydrogenase